MYRNGERLLPDTDASAGQIAEVIDQYGKTTEKIALTGPGAALLYNTLPPELKAKIDLIDENRGYAKELIEVAEKYKIINNNNTDRLFEGPEYIRKSDAELNLTGNVGS
jgi:hypothetical protein